MVNWYLGSTTLIFYSESSPPFLGYTILYYRAKEKGKSDSALAAASVDLWDSNSCRIMIWNQESKLCTIDLLITYLY